MRIGGFRLFVSMVCGAIFIGKSDKAIDDALNDPFVQTINSVLDLF